MSIPKKIRIHFGELVTRRGLRIRSVVAVAPGLLWTSIFLFVPLAALVVISFLSRGDYGELQLPFTFSNYQRLAGLGEPGFDAVYPRIVGRTVLLAAGTVAGCLVAGLPLAFFISNLPRRWRAAGLVLVAIPFWTNLLIRTYAWQIILSPGGWLARGAAALGLIPVGDGLYPGSFAVFLVMVCDYLPFFVLPLYASVEKIDWTLADAARDLGAGCGRVFWHALLPQIRPGLWAGIMLVFLPALGQFVIPDLLGGARTVLLGNVIQQQFVQSRDWPFGVALVCGALLVMLAGCLVFGGRRGNTSTGGWG